MGVVSQVAIVEGGFNCLVQHFVIKFLGGENLVAIEEVLVTFVRRILIISVEKSSQISPDDLDIFNRSVVGVGSHLLNGIYHIETGNDFAKDRILTV